MARLILVSNRVSMPKDGASQRAGGLEVALAPILDEIPSVWFGWSGNVVSAGEVTTRTLERGMTTYVVTDLSEEDYQEYYNGFANRVLWPVLHYRIDLTEFSRRDLTGYFRVNSHFAQQLAKVLRSDDAVWVHDYHLIPLAAELRKKGYENRIGFFLHVPFPAPEVVTVLPNHDRLLPLFLDYDLVGFQTETDVGNFMRYLVAEDTEPKRRAFEVTDNQLIVTSGTSRTRIGAFPVGIDAERFERRARRAAQSQFVLNVVENLGKRALVIGVDRLDYSKGLLQRMEAIERYFALYPDWRAKVTFLQIAPKSRSEIPEYADLEQAVGAAAGRINGTYGEAAWTPLRYVNRTYGRSALAGLYRAAQVGLVTPLRDGMNLVAKEYVAAQDPDNPGVLILSRFAGAAAELKQALLVNPYDAEAVAAAIDRALRMPLAERRDRHSLMFQTLLRNGTRAWSARFLNSLAPSLTEQLRARKEAKPAPRQPRAGLVSRPRNNLRAMGDWGKAR
ncbi:MAG TPA: trehalose-6-phosphate synthase [Methyloceanibacter sp.]|nr:trehalose-6-phosphate synthase [Methyloceanibacter sp.]